MLALIVRKRDTSEEAQFYNRASELEHITKTSPLRMCKIENDSSHLTADEECAILGMRNSIFYEGVLT